MSGAWGAAAAGASLVAGALGANSAKKQWEASKDKYKKLQWATLGFGQNILAKQLHIAKQNKGLVGKAFTGAKGALTTQQAASQQQALAGAQQLGGAVTSGVIGSGLSSSTVAKNMQLGAQQKAAQTLAGIDADYAQLLAGLGLQEAEAEAAANEGIANVYGKQAELYGKIQQNIASLYSGGPQAGVSYDFGGLGLALEDLLGDKTAKDYAMSAAETQAGGSS